MKVNIDESWKKHLNKEFDDRVKKGERLFTLYSSNKEKVNLANKALGKLAIFKIGK